MSLIIECYHFCSNRVSILVEVQKFIYKIVPVSIVLTNIKTSFVMSVGILITHSPSLKHQKTVFIYIFVGFPLIKTPHLLILETFVSPLPPQLFGLPPPHLFGTEACLFRTGVFLVITGCGKKKRNVRFLVRCAGLAVCCCWSLVVCGSLWLFASGLLLVCWWFAVVCGGLWLFLPVACFSNYACIFSQRNLYNSFIHSSLSSIFECSKQSKAKLNKTKNGHSNVCFKKLITPLYIFKYFF